jgi:hypothetical protein
MSSAGALSSSLIDDDHGPHWEAGDGKKNGQRDSVNRPRRTNDKKKVVG